MGTVEHLRNTTFEELKEWLSMPDAEQKFYVSRHQEIKLILEGNNLKTVFRQLDYLNTWYSNNFVYAALNSGNLQYQLQIASNGYQIIKIINRLAELYPNNPPKIAFDRYLYWLANCFICGWEDKCREITEIINKHLETNLLKGGVAYKPTAWYLLSLANKYFNIETNFQQYNYPTSLGVYDDVLKNWNTVDIEFVNKLVEKMCAYHVHQSDPKDQENLLAVQFSLTYEFVYVFEILAWLSIRKMRSLENPVQFTHALINLPVNSYDNYQSVFKEYDFYKHIMNVLA